MMKRTCSLPDCGKPHKAQGYCNTHYFRAVSRGEVTPGPRIRPPAQRFWPKVDKNGPVPEARPKLGPCWLWTAALSGQGLRYGYFYDGTRNVYAHRWAWESVNGPIPDGLTIDHLCFTTKCVNPAHLEAVPGAVNTRRYMDTITHCPYGHEYTEANTYYGTDKYRSRVCRKCRNRRVQEAKAKRLARMEER